MRLELVTRGLELITRGLELVASQSKEAKEDEDVRTWVGGLMSSCYSLPLAF